MSPTCFITFLSYTYGGRARYKISCGDSGIFNSMDSYDEVMADRGIHITEELMLKYCALRVPAAARIKLQMSNSEVKKTKKFLSKHPCRACCKSLEKL